MDRGSCFTSHFKRRLDYLNDFLVNSDAPSAHMIIHPSPGVMYEKRALCGPGPKIILWPAALSRLLNGFVRSIREGLLETKNVKRPTQLSGAFGTISWYIWTVSNSGESAGIVAPKEDLVCIQIPLLNFKNVFGDRFFKNFTNFFS